MEKISITSSSHERDFANVGGRVWFCVQGQRAREDRVNDMIKFVLEDYEEIPGVIRDDVRVKIQKN